jgi:hypothetical protein
MDVTNERLYANLSIASKQKVILMVAKQRRTTKRARRPSEAKRARDPSRQFNGLARRDQPSLRSSDVRAQP